MKRLPAILVALALCGCVAVGAYWVVGHALELAHGTLTGLDGPVSDDSTPVTFTVEPGQSAARIGEALQAQGLVRSAQVFRLLVEQEGVGNRLAAGEYELSPSMSTREVVAALAGGRVRRGLSVTVPEGWRAEEIAWKLNAIAPGSGDDFLGAVYDPAGYAADLDLPAGASLEGFLFPDTYEWRPQDGGKALVGRMVNEFLRKFDARRRDKASAHGLSLRDAVTLASIVEREAVLPEERPLIAAVYYNRLALDMPLQADPTVQYALAEPEVPAPGEALWKRDLSLDDLDVASSYNTYRHKGLPAGPICSPGLASLDAVAEPASTDALYFVARADGSHVFARTLDEHLANVRREQASNP
ncbi:MAG TPA: endolytic transglycosylase MltG [Chloroflexota bacterium]|nr:endolytic transglycosylase MltG [Chloroflexota bacterium]